VTTSVTTVNPATGSVLATYLADTSEAVDAALVSATEAARVWAATPIEDRLDLLRRVGKLLTERREEYAALITAEMGKPISEALAEVDKCAWNCALVAELAPSWTADHEAPSSASRSWVSYEPSYEPLGVIFAVMPWKYPFWQVLRFASAAIAAGNAAALKHAPNSTGSALAIQQLFADSGSPAGLFVALVVADHQRDGRLRPSAPFRWRGPQRLRPRALGRGHPRVHQHPHRVRRGGVMSKQDHTLDHVGLAVGELDAMTRWYTNVLRLTVEFEFALGELDFKGGVMLRSADRYRIELLHRDGNRTGLQAADPVAAALTRGFGHIALDDADVDVAFTEFVESGAAERMSPRPSPEPGVRMAYVADPEGNLIELLDLTTAQARS
jgi:catechol 2,3-dioxygenase-like lactoylglutathione lyase family enzyme